MTESTSQQPLASSAKESNQRWFIVAMGTLLQMCIGTVYAWSYFQSLLVRQYPWDNTEVAWVFSLTILCLSLGAIFGGRRLATIGARKLAVTGGIMFGLGYLIGALALSIQSLALLYLGYSVVGGFGIGLAYVTPVATVAKWFPDKKGLATGMVIMGFGLGAMLMSKIFAPILIDVAGGDLAVAFGMLGVLFLVLTVPVASFMREPDSGANEGKSPHTETTQTKNAADADQAEAKAVMTSSQYLITWLVFFCNTTAGIMFIGFQSPMLQEMLSLKDPAMTREVLVAAGATLIAVSSLFNGVGRLFWGSVSDRLGQIQVFRIMLASQIAVFLLLLINSNPWVFGILVCYVLLCYGGGFGTMPSMIANLFGARLMPVLYGTILTAWGAAGIAGPQITALIRDLMPEQSSTYAFITGCVFLGVGLVVSFRLKPAST